MTVAAVIGESLDLLRKGHAVVAETVVADECEPTNERK